MEVRKYTHTRRAHTQCTHVMHTEKKILCKAVRRRGKLKPGLYLGEGILKDLLRGSFSPSLGMVSLDKGREADGSTRLG